MVYYLMKYLDITHSEYIRKETFAYIDLNTPFFNPHAYKAILRIYRDIDRIIAGTLNVSINSDGMLVRDENGSTGLKFIYDNWNKIKWEKTHGMKMKG